MEWDDHAYMGDFRNGFFLGVRMRNRWTSFSLHTVAKKETDGGSTDGKQSGGFSRMHSMTVVPGLCSSFFPSKSEGYRRRLSVETALCAFIL